MCGEKRPDWKNEVELVGSPPRVRGKDAIQRHPSCGFGITPACAGKRRTDSKTTLSHEDHPRVCGEKTPFSENSFTKSGSPPRVRGKGVVCIIRGRAGGITPACAGKSCRLPKSSRHFWDHPRVCGEKPGTHIPPVCDIGSPPRVRGKGLFDTSNLHISGITPACAGKRIPGFRLIFANGDHPRVCGEKYEDLMYNPKVMGSPPRVRGKVFGLVSRVPGLGITPACAGKSKE